MNRNKFIFLVSALGMLVFLWQCKHLPTEEVLPSSPNHSTPNPPYIPPPDTVCFSSDILPLIISNCAKQGCHDALGHKDNKILTGYSSIYNVRYSLYAVASTTPGTSHLSDMTATNFYGQKLIKMDSASLAKLNKWINQGAINSICNSCDTVNVKYSTHIQPFIKSYCAGCHTYTSGTMLTNYTQVKAKVTDGKLYCSLTWSSGCKPMPDGGAKLSDCKIRMVKIWIDSGAPDN